MLESAAPVRRIPANGRWDVSQEFTTIQNNTELKAAPGAGLALYVSDIYLAAKGVVDITLKQGTTTLKFKYYANGAGDGVKAGFIEPLRLAENTPLTISTDANIAVTAVIVGYTAAV